MQKKAKSSRPSIAEISGGYSIHDNALTFRSVGEHSHEGVKLSAEEREYLLPHFLMLLVGKPGSGKSTLLKQLLTNPQMYHKKFDDVFFISPSHQKMDLSLKKDHVTNKFSLDWIFQKFDEINEDQHDKIFGGRPQQSKEVQRSKTGNSILSGNIVLKDNRSRFLLSDAFASTAVGQARHEAQRRGQQLKDHEEQNARDEAHKQHMSNKRYKELKKLPQEQQEKYHRNVLIVLDDVVNAIKKSEFDQRLGQLVMNRRHLIFNGTVSIIMVTQKYTLIPSRVRSNASWLVLYQLNPADFELAYHDVVTMPKHQWFSVLHFIFGVDLYSKGERKIVENETEEIKEDDKQMIEEKKENEEEKKEPVVKDGILFKEYKEWQDQQHDSKIKPETRKSTIMDEIKAKRFENIGIWVEVNMYFKNFKRIKL